MKQKEKIAAFISIEFGMVILCTLPLFLLHAEPASSLMLLTSIIFMFLPALTTLIVKRMAHDKGGLFLQLNIRKAWKQYLLAALIPGALEGIGVALYFFIFPSHLDLSLTYAAQLLTLNGQTVELPQLSLPLAIGVGLLLILAAPLVIVNHAAAFGEEIGWRSFLLPLLMDELGARKAVLLDGVLWGIAHAPLVWGVSGRALEWYSYDGTFCVHYRNIFLLSDAQIPEHFSGLHRPWSNQCHSGSAAFDLFGYL